MLIDQLSEWPLARRLVAWLPEGMRTGPAAYPCLVEIDLSGAAIAARTVWISGPAAMPSISTALERDGKIYMTPAGLNGTDDRRILVANVSG